MNVIFECINVDPNKIAMAVTASPTPTKTLVLSKTELRELAESIFVYLGTPIPEAKAYPEFSGKFYTKTNIPEK